MATTMIERKRGSVIKNRSRERERQRERERERERKRERFADPVKVC